MGWEGAGIGPGVAGGWGSLGAGVAWGLAGTSLHVGKSAGCIWASSKYGVLRAVGLLTGQLRAAVKMF